MASRIRILVVKELFISCNHVRNFCDNFKLAGITNAEWNYSTFGIF